MSHTNTDLDGRDEHFIRSVAKLGDCSTLLSTQPIYNSRKVKLVETGARVDSRLLDRLLAHKLLEPIDRCVNVENAFSAQDFADALTERLEQAPAFAAMLPAFGTSTALQDLCRRVHIEPQLAVKLTVAREMNPRLLQRTLDVALVCGYLSRKIGKSPEDTVCALSAGLFLDIGLLHIDPAILASQASLTVAQRRHIYSHPVIAYHILNEYPQYRGAIATAVLQHHERFDGSGYPGGLLGPAISPLGQALMLADVTGAVLRRSDSEPVRANVWTAFGLARHKFSPQLIDLVIELAGDHAEHPHDTNNAPMDPADMQRAFGRITAVMSDWGALVESRSITGDAEDPFVNFVRDRVDALARALAEAGFDWRNGDEFVRHMGTSPAAGRELNVFAREALWHLRDLLHEAYREHARFSQTGAPGGPGSSDVLAWSDRSLAALDDTPV